MSGLEHLSEIQKREAAEHDKNVALLEPTTVLAAAKDLGRRRYHDRRDPEHRWGMARKAALLRRIARENLTATTP